MPLPDVSLRLPCLPRALVAGAGLALLCVLPCALVSGAGAQTQLPTNFIDQLIVQGLNEPVGMAFLPDQRMLIIERQGAIRLIAEGKLGAVDPLLFLDNVNADGDRGASGVAVDPRWPAKPYLYFYYENNDSTCKILRYAAGGDLSNPSSLYLTIDPASRFD